MAAGSLAGHLIECGAQATGGNHTDWHQIQGFDNLGFPVAEVSEDGSMLITKPPGTGGKVSFGTVAEQMLYEIGDGQSYLLPDVTADFSQVRMAEVEDGVMVTGARGRAPSDTFKISATYMDGFKATCVCNFVGGNAVKKAEVIAASTFDRTRRLFAKAGIKDFDKVHVQVLGSEASFGVGARGHESREAVLWMAVKHQDKRAIQLWAKEIAAAGTGGTPGITAFVGGRPKPSPCLKMYSFLYPKTSMPATVSLGDQKETYTPGTFPSEPAADISISQPTLVRGENSFRLNDLAFTRSGDKGNSCNIGVIARHPSYLPYLREQLTETAVAEHFAHVFEGEGTAVVRRFDLPGVDAMNFVLEASLGGGGIASLTPDPLGKAYGQILSEYLVTGLPSLGEIRGEQ